MKTPKKNQFQSCYCKFLYDNFIIEWWVHQNNFYWKMQGTKTIILSSVIQNYKIFLQPNSKNDILIKIYVWVWVLHICQKHAFIIIIMEWAFSKNLITKAVMHGKEGLVKWLIFYLRHIKIISCHMVSICFIHHMTWRWQQCVHIHHKKYALPHWKCVLRCCAQCPRIDLPSPESDHKN